MSRDKWKSDAEIIEMLKKDLRPRMTLIGEYVTSQAKLMCPVDYGNLRGSIHYQEFETNNSIGVRVGTPVEYAPYIEFGTGVFAENGQGRKTPWVYFHERLQQFFTTIGMIAKPFIRPAFLNSKNEIRRILGSGHGIKK